MRICCQSSPFEGWLTERLRARRPQAVSCGLARYGLKWEREIVARAKKVPRKFPASLFFCNDAFLVVYPVRQYSKRRTWVHSNAE